MQHLASTLDDDGAENGGFDRRRGRRSLYAAQCIRDMIVSGELPAGDRIPERVITERLDISRTPLREALKILEAEGLVRISPNRGAMVVQLSLSDVEAVIEMLIGMELHAAELACQRGTDEEIAEAERLHHEMVAAFERRDLLGYFNVNQLIHLQIFLCAHNDALVRVYRAESARIRRYRFASNREPSRWARAVLEHEMILDALKRREGAILRELLRAHHWSGWKATRKVLEPSLP
ncbi:GntR family transcriptional regulator [Acuticoccus kandeliae]|uniref:GntR family transcriptional regulator n=1 Tax=Acuticoccus kandeliae TaxID=2073160 RepID=UPI000D3E5C0D|nr:GntR family transcriptional regulator [Acuticoccus kandeliae]